MALVIINSVAALASLWLVPLALHIYSCTAGQKWCHLQAFGLGLPSAFVLFILLAFTASCTLGDTNASCSKALRIMAWLPLAIAGIVLLALVGAVAHNR